MSHYYICVTPFFPSSDNWRGAYILDQVKAIKRNSDYEIIVILPTRTKSLPKPYTIEGIKVYYIYGFFMPSYFFNGFGGEINQYYFKDAIKKLNINWDSISVVHVHTAAFACYAKVSKKYNNSIKTVIQYHDLDPYQIRLGKFATWRPNVKYRIKKFISYFNYIDLHLCISRKTEYNLLHFPLPHPQDNYLPYLKALNSAKNIKTPRNLNTYVLYNGVDKQIFYPLTKNEDHKIYKIGCVSNFNELKDHITLIKAIEEIVNKEPEITLLVSFIGSGDTMQSCKDYIKNHNLEKYFKFETEVSHDNLNSYYNTLSLFVLPSCFEGFGCVYMEAAACGIPFIGCENQGYSEYINKDEINKWLIKPHDYNALADLILKQIKNPSSQKLVHTFDIDELITSYIKYIEEL